MFIEAAKVSDIAPGGMKAVDIRESKIVVCNYDNAFYAVGRRCGHVGAPLDMGTLEGYILTCPLHFAQFDITTGEVLSGPVPPDPKHQTRGLATYPVQIEADTIKVDVS
jgi:nitrite reductase/ring-hydroxylating ferredoxin subunit